jgi:hypothetical protein
MNRFAHQYNETNVMHFSFSLLRNEGLYMFRALLAQLQPYHRQITLHARNIPNAVCVAPPEGEQVMLETCRCLQFSINRTKSASRCFHYSDIQSDSLVRGPTEVYLQIFNEFVNQLTDY